MPSSVYCDIQPIVPRGVHTSRPFEIRGGFSQFVRPCSTCGEEESGGLDLVRSGPGEGDGTSVRLTGISTVHGVCRPTTNYGRSNGDVWEIEI